jgi:outer membrane protein TolC
MQRRIAKKMTRTATTLLSLGLLTISLLSLSQTSFALPDSLSFNEAEQVVQHRSYSIESAKANVSAARNQAQASSHLWTPIVTLDARAIKYRSDISVPLSNIKSASENAANQALQQGLSNAPVSIPADVANQITSSFSNSLSGLLDRLPNSSNFVIESSMFRPTVSAVMPIYSGGSITAAQNLAQLDWQKSELTLQQTTQQQTMRLIEAYFGEQLAKQLLSLSTQNLDSLTAHLNQAIKLEQQGMINHGQRLQAEVAKQAAQRQFDQASSHEESSRYALQQLLNVSQLPSLSTPLFINTSNLPAIDTFLQAYQVRSPMANQLKLDQTIAKQGVALAKANIRPNAYLFGQQTLNKTDWIIGVGARYTLLSNVDRLKMASAAQDKVTAAEAMTAQVEQDTQQIIVRAYHEANAARKAFLSMQTDIKSAEENLRIQQTSFREGETTAPFVNDAVSALNATYSDQATAAYRYDMALATLLGASGQIDQFKAFLTQPDFMSVNAPRGN